METQFKKISPNLMVINVESSIKFYTEVLGFELIMSVKESENPNQKVITNSESLVYALIKSGNVEIMLQREDTLKDDLPNIFSNSIGSSSTLYLEVKNMSPIVTKIKKLISEGQEINIVKDVHQTWYGASEFYLKDNSGYILCLGEMVQE